MMAMCRRKSAWEGRSGIAKRDKSGAEFWLYPLKESPSGTNETITVPESQGEGPELADVETRDRVYNAVLDALELSAKHRSDLTRRGLDQGEISRGRYRSLPARFQPRLATAIAARFDRATLRTVPGFFRNPRGELSVSMLPGLLIPTRDREGRIVALTLRPDEKLDKDAKYIWVSSSRHNGPSPGAPPHVPLGTAAPVATWRLTEGVLKADVATRLSGVPTVGAPGATNWRVCIPVLMSLGCTTVRLAFDADAWEKPNIGQALSECAKAAKAAGLNVELERWDPSAGNGIDDVLLAGGAIEVLTGVDAARAIAEAAPPEAPSEAPRPSGGDDRTDVVFTTMSDDHLGIVKLATVTEDSVSWLWPYRMERGGLALVAGDAGQGKTMVLLHTAATVSRGGPWPDGSGDAPLGNVVIVSAEDRPKDAIKPRLIALDADIERVTIVKAKYIIQRKDKEPVVHFASFQDHGYWREVFRRIGDVVLFIVDPIPSYLGRGVNDSKNIEIRQVLEPFLQEVIEPLQICMLGNTHLNKSVDSRTPLYRVTGSIAYGAIPRNLHFVVRDPEEPSRRFFKQAKCNDAPEDLPALAYTIEPREIPGPNGKTIETAIPVFEPDPVAVDLHAIVNGRKREKPGREPKQTVAATEWLYDYLDAQPGPTPIREIFNAAGLAGLAGEQDSKGYWSSVSKFYDACELIPSLPPPRAGKKVEVYEAPLGRSRRLFIHWRLVENDSEPEESQNEPDRTP
jgi:hypothetical protein